MNKNTKRIRKIIRKEGKQGNDEVSLLVPGYKYHDDSKPTLVKKSFHTARVRAGGVVSVNRARNMQMVVSKNKGEDGKGFSLTSHEQIDRKRPCRFPNHSYTKDSYRQPASNRS